LSYKSLAEKELQSEWLCGQQTIVYLKSCRTKFQSTIIAISELQFQNGRLRFPAPFGIS